MMSSDSASSSAWRATSSSSGTQPLSDAASSPLPTRRSVFTRDGDALRKTVSGRPSARTQQEELGARPTRACAAPRLQAERVILGLSSTSSPIAATTPTGWRPTRTPQTRAPPTCSPSGAPDGVSFNPFDIESSVSLSGMARHGGLGVRSQPSPRRRPPRGAPRGGHRRPPHLVRQDVVDAVRLLHDRLPPTVVVLRRLGGCARRGHGRARRCLAHGRPRRRRRRGDHLPPLRGHAGRRLPAFKALHSDVAAEVWTTMGKNRRRRRGGAPRRHRRLRLVPLEKPNQVLRADPHVAVACVVADEFTHGQNARYLVEQSAVLHLIIAQATPHALNRPSAAGRASSASCSTRASARQAPSTSSCATTSNEATKAMQDKCMLDVLTPRPSASPCATT